MNPIELELPGLPDGVTVQANAASVTSGHDGSLPVAEVRLAATGTTPENRPSTLAALVGAAFAFLSSVVVLRGPDGVRLASLPEGTLTQDRDGRLRIDWRLDTFTTGTVRVVATGSVVPG